jgi:hypothetical protein
MSYLKQFTNSIENLFTNRFKFELSDLGDMSQYTFSELAHKLPNFHISIDSYPDYFVATFESRTTVISIKYKSIGTYVAIVNQDWRDWH